MLDLGTLKIGIEVDDKQAKQELGQISGDVESKASGLKSKLTSLAGSMKKVLVASAAAGATAISAAVVKISKDALKAYSEFEQLEGGVNKIFGEKAAQTVMNNAQKAFKTAGISANEYMEQVTSFSASLIQSLEGDTEKAAKSADMAIQDMSDNANTFGTSIESIQNAYQGFAKQNYTMLDNLKLGYGGTKQEMERLLADAEEFSGIHYDISNLDDVYNAIHVVQEEMGVAGTTAKEAMSTIEGSVNATKAAWQNFLIGLGNEDADMNQLVNNLFTSASAALKNIIPRLGQIVKALITTLINTAKNAVKNGQLSKIADSIIDEVKTWPGKIFKFIGNALNSLADMFEEEGGSKFASAAGEIVVKIGSAFIKNLPNILKGAIRLAVNAAEASFNGLFTIIKTVMGKIKTTVVNIWNEIKRKISEKLSPVINSGPIQTLISWVKSAIAWWNDLREKLRHPIKAIINTSKRGSSGGNADEHPSRIGIREVPYDNYPALLHRGETVLTAAESNIYQKAMNKLLDSNSLTDNKQPASNVTNSNYYYSFGDITVDVSKLEDVKTVNEFVDMMKQAKAFV